MKAVFEAAHLYTQAIREVQRGTTGAMEKAAKLYGEAASILHVEALKVRNLEVRERMLDRAEQAARRAATCWDELGNRYFATKRIQELH